MRKPIPEAEDLIWPLHRENIVDLKNFGYDDLTKLNPHIVIKCIRLKLELYYLKTPTPDIVEWRKEANLDNRITTRSCVKLLHKRENFSKKEGRTNVKDKKIYLTKIPFRIRRTYIFLQQKNFRHARK